MTWGQEWGFEWGSSDSSMDMVERIASRVFTRLRTRQSESTAPSVEDVARWIGENLQQIEEILHDVRWFTDVANAFGVQLDMHAAGLGTVRDGQTDAELRDMLIARFGALFRRRTPKLIQDILMTLSQGTDSTFEYREYYPAAFEITLSDISPEAAARWERVVRTAKLEGVRMTTLVVEDSSSSFRFDTVGRGFDQGNEFAYTLES